MIANAQGETLAANIRQFMRLLRMSGSQLGINDVFLAEQAVALVGFGSKRMLKQALSSVCVRNRDERQVFEQAFNIFWQSHGKTPLDALAEYGIKPKVRERGHMSRVWESLYGAPKVDPDGEGETKQRGSWSRDQAFQHKDFATMSREEFAKALQIIKEGHASLPTRRQRRWKAAGHGSLDWAREIKRAARQPWSISAPRRITHQERPWPLVTLLDISGSMESYSRMFLTYIHTLAQIREISSETFVFSTRTVRITPWLKGCSTDQALARLGHNVDMWEGGTNIGHCLQDFLANWRKRLLYHPSMVLFITDGLDRADGAILEEGLIALRRTGARVVWLNPLLRFDGYEALADGASRLQRHAHRVAKIHNIHCLRQLNQELWGLTRY